MEEERPIGMKVFGILNILFGLLLLWRSRELFIVVLMLLTVIFSDKSGYLPLIFYLLCLLLVSSGILLLSRGRSKLRIGRNLSLIGSLLLSLYIPYMNWAFHTTTWGFPYKAFQGFRAGYFSPFFCLVDCSRGVWNIDHGALFYPLYFLIMLFYFTRPKATEGSPRRG